MIATATGISPKELSVTTSIIQKVNTLETEYFMLIVLRAFGRTSNEACAVRTRLFRRNGCRLTLTALSGIITIGTTTGRGLLPFLVLYYLLESGEELGFGHFVWPSWCLSMSPTFISNLFKQISLKYIAPTRRTISTPIPF